MSEPCTWCGAEVEADDGFRAYLMATTDNVAASTGERRAVFCRLEHVIPWVIQDAHWEAGAVDEPASIDEGLETCSHCDAPLTDTHVLLVRHRGEHRVTDGFCSVDHLRAWASAGGRWR